jgi:hypothetical protein
MRDRTPDPDRAAPGPLRRDRHYWRVDVAGDEVPEAFLDAVMAALWPDERAEPPGEPGRRAEAPGEPGSRAEAPREVAR